jgi:hypothetical protein
MNLAELETAFQRYITNLPVWIPDGIVQVDLSMLQRLDLLECDQNSTSDQLITHYFHVIESQEKISLFNDQFLVWIVPEMVDNIPTTYTLIAIRNGTESRLELAFSTSGIYNTSRLVLRVLEKLLLEIQETQDELNKLKV